ncbi:nucleoside 2-deoxyribosyltransferase [Spirosoma migulaei]
MKICLVGDIFVDITLKTNQHDTKMRLGGIVHAARGLWALGIPYSVGYFAPAYLDKQINEYLIAFECEEVHKLGNVIGSPYIFLIQDAKEVFDQGYEFILRNEIEIEYFKEAIHKLNDKSFSDILLFAGNFDHSVLFDVIKRQKIHIDVTNSIRDISSLQANEVKVDTIFLSTSSILFQEHFKDNFNNFKNKLAPFCNKFILKENRGGSRGFNFISNEYCEASSQTKPIVHSVGVGDVYNAAFISKCLELKMQSSMIFSSWIAAEYASTTYPDDLKININRILNSNFKELENMAGISLPWEQRRQINVYIAAPDFDFVDTSPIENVVNSLNYHNFSPRRPVKENGQMADDANKNRRQELFSKDMIMLEQCQILIAVLLYNDPGTLIEIGLASAKGLPTIVYDPYQIAKNCMLTELPDLVTNDLDYLIAEFFSICSKLQI